MPRIERIALWLLPVSASVMFVCSVRTPDDNANRAVVPIKGFSGSAAKRVEFVAERKLNYASPLNLSLSETNPVQRSIRFGTLLREWFEKDPEGALDYLRHMGNSAEYTEGVMILLPKIAEGDPERALALASEFVRGLEQEQIYSVLFDRLGSLNAGRALKAFDAMQPGEGRFLALHALATRWVNQDVSYAISQALGLKDEREKNVVMKAALKSLAKTDANRSLEIAEKYLTGDAHDEMIGEGIKHLANNDPETAATWAATLPPGRDRTEAETSIARALAKEDPEKALVWLKTLPAGAGQLDGTISVLDSWSKTDPTAAGQYVTQLPAGSEQDAVALRLAERMAGDNPSSAIEWAQGLTTDSARNSAVDGIARRWAQKEPSEAAQWAMSLPGEFTARPEAIKGAFANWALQDPKTAGAAVLKLPEADQAFASGVVAQALAHADAPFAQHWAESLPAGQGRETALREVQRWRE